VEREDLAALAVRRREAAELAQAAARRPNPNAPTPTAGSRSYGIWSARRQPRKPMQRPKARTLQQGEEDDPLGAVEAGKLASIDL